MHMHDACADKDEDNVTETADGHDDDLQVIMLIVFSYNFTNSS